MKPLDLTKCVVCGNESFGGMYGDKQDRDKSIPVCHYCFESGNLKRWWDNSVQEIANSGLHTDWTGNIALDLDIVRADQRQSERIDDGVCLNGCARLESMQEPGYFACPVCNFMLIKSSLSV